MAPGTDRLTQSQSRQRNLFRQAQFQIISASYSVYLKQRVVSSEVAFENSVVLWKGHIVEGLAKVRNWMLFDVCSLNLG